MQFRDRNELIMFKFNTFTSYRCKQYSPFCKPEWRRIILISAMLIILCCAVFNSYWGSVVYGMFQYHGFSMTSNDHKMCRLSLCLSADETIQWLANAAVHTKLTVHCKWDFNISYEKWKEQLPIGGSKKFWYDEPGHKLIFITYSELQEGKTLF